MASEEKGLEILKANLEDATIDQGKKPHIFVVLGASVSMNQLVL